jgi:hypothetical protein
MEIERNEPCPCGSKKKYKKCCLLETTPSRIETIPSPDLNELKKYRGSAIHERLTKKLMSHTLKVYGKEAIDEAYDEFFLFEAVNGFDPHSLELPVFIPWFFNQWYPDAEISSLMEAPEIPPAQSLAETGEDLSSEELKHLLECLKTSFSFFEIIDIVLNRSLKLKNILTEEYHNVSERKGTHGVQAGDIFFGQVIAMDDLEILQACAPIVIRPDLKIHIIELRKKMRKKNRVIDHKLLRHHGIEVLEVYRHIYETITNPPKKILTNTEGDLFIPHKLNFEIDDSMEVFEALHHLVFNETKNELLEHAKFHRDGKLKQIKFPWLMKGNQQHKTWDNTVLGHINIYGTKMTVEVNSKERAKKFEILLKKLLPSGWKLKATVIESIESQIKNTKKSKSKDDDLNKKQQAEMMANPEIQKHMEKMMKSHWDEWPFKPIPALGGLKPVDAVKTKDGRELLEALLIQFERNFVARPQVGQTLETIKEVRQKLGL